MQSNISNTLSQLKESGIDPLTAVMTSLDNLFRFLETEHQDIKGYLISDNFKYHYENNPHYRLICQEKGVSPVDIQTFEDLSKLPLIPVSNFKQTDSHLLLSKPLNEIEFEMKSTGTSGIPSISRRDSESISRALFGIYSMYREMFTFSRGAGLFLFPSSEEVPEMGMVKVLNMFSGMFDATRCLVKRASFKPIEAIEALQKWGNLHNRHIVGPPFLIYKLVNYLKENNIRLQLDKQTRIITLGGWKRFIGSEIPREQFNEECSEYLGIQADQIRDMYGLVEANMLAIECEHHSKHIPPWVHFSVRDVKDLSLEVPRGKRGVLAIIDPTSLSYPGFILTEDLVYLEKEYECACGRTGQKVVYISRISGAEIGCCAINLEKQMDEAETDPSCIVAR
jgi:long-chain-fatty-acid---luciferin-component ligase